MAVGHDYEAIRATITELTHDLARQARGEAWKVYQRAPHALELAELESIALLGLSQAAAKFVSYNETRGYAPDDFRYFHAYCIRRMRGAMLDAMRGQDWVTRSARAKAKQIRDAGQDQGLGEAELAAASGLTVTEVRETLAAVAGRPVSIDAEPQDVRDPGDVEGQVVVSSVLAAASAVVRKCPGVVQELLALRYYHGWTLADAARALGVEQDEAVQLHQAAVLAVHDAMLRAVT